MSFYIGVVENRMDPLELCRCQVRVVGLHTHDKGILPTADLPWAYPLGDLRSASMNGIGESPLGPVEGTTVLVMFQDTEMQQPIMLGTLGGIPQGEGAVDNSDPELILSEDQTQLQGIPLVSDDGAKIDPGVTPIPLETASPVANGSVVVPGQPPYNQRAGSGVKINSNWVPGILAIGRAMDTLGVTESYARAAILGIVGGECDYVPQNEGCRYSPSRLQQVFSWMTPDQVKQYANWPGKPEDFFGFVYGPDTRSGKNLGNKNPNDGALYFGRGYIQLTGNANYKRYAGLSGVDIVNNPSQLNDLDKGALVAVAYFKDRVKVAQNDPGYFEAACRAVGFNVPNIKAKKEQLYQYWLLGDVNATKTEAPPALDATPGSHPANVTIAPNGLPADRQTSRNLGFRDPNMKYPLREFLNEPDTNRLARGVTRGTSVQMRDNMRVTGIPKADDTTFDQPPVPYNGKYPFNAVRQTESGHIQEFDDTPGNERINLMHRSGTFTEVDVNGTQVTRIVGDGYEIVDRNGYVFVKGAYSMTVEGKTNILISADANIVVEGHTDIKAKGGLDMSITGDFNLTVGGSWTTTVGGSFSQIIQGDRKEQVTGSDRRKAGIVAVEALLRMDLRAGGMLAADGSVTRISSGSALPSFVSLTPALAPESGAPINNEFEQLLTPPRNFESDTLYETPEEVKSPEGVAFHKQRDENIVGDKTDPATITPEEKAATVENNATPTVASCDLIYSMADFPLGMKLSQNYSLGNLIADPKHILVNQNLSDDGNTREYKKSEIVCNLKGLAENILEPLIDLIPGGRKGFIITSGYRYSEGKPTTSDHPKGNAVDIVLAGANFDYKAHYDMAQKLAAVLPFHQLILEYRDPSRAGNSRNQRIVWLHISHRYTGPKRMAFTMLNDKTYGQGFSLLT